MATFYNQNAGTNKFKSRNDFQAAKLFWILQKKNHQKNWNQNSVWIWKILNQEITSKPKRLKVPLTFLNSSKENLQKNHQNGYQNRVWIWKNMYVNQEIIPSQTSKSSVKYVVPLTILILKKKNRNWVWIWKILLIKKWLSSRNVKKFV